MQETHQQLEEKLKSIIYSGALSGIDFYQVNNNFFELADEGYWIIDAGIELKFPGGIISAAFNDELELYVIDNNPVSKIYGGNNYHILDNKNILELKKIIGLNVVNAEFTNLEFEYVVDYTMRTDIEKRFVQLILEFQNKSKIQIAFINYVLEENKGPEDFSFDLSTNLLVSTKKIMEIKT